MKGGIGSETEPDHVKILRAINEIPFNVGGNLLVDFLQGNRKNKSITSNKMYDLDTFGCLDLMSEDIKYILDKLTINRMVNKVSPSFNKFVKVYEITPVGIKELSEPKLHKGFEGALEPEKYARVTEDDRRIFAGFGSFLEKFNDEQKKSIVSSTEKILCIAGAGTGKTTTLTKRIEFLVRFRSVSPSKVLAITFTRKAKRQLEERLARYNGCNAVNVETFNSFCERMLQRHGKLIYPKPVRMINFSGKAKLVTEAMKILKINGSAIVRGYFSGQQRRNKTERELFASIVNDCFYVIDFFKSDSRKISHSKLMLERIEERKRPVMDRFLDACILTDALMKKGGFRDYSDQLEDTIRLFTKFPDTIPPFEHVLVDEYQDVNSSQIKFIDLLGPKNVFAVGDPRQAIFGWRGSKIDYILDFEKKYDGCEIIPLVKNYRSGKGIVDAANETIKLMGLPDIEPGKEIADTIELNNYDSEKDELYSVSERIENLDIEPNEIFVLARTNRQLLDLSQILKSKGIKHVVKSDELLRSKKEAKDDIILSTIHAIKGLEARIVFVIGCTRTNFPCRASEHPVTDMFSMHNYDKEEEERRLFYVALTRAKERLVLSYYGKTMTNYINRSVMKMISESMRNMPKIKVSNSTARQGTKRETTRKEFAPSGDLVNDLKTWRLMQADLEGVPAYMVLSNRALHEICKLKPDTKDKLSKVNGIGPVKLERYGDELISILSKSE